MRNAERGQRIASAFRQSQSSCRSTTPGLWSVVGCLSSVAALLLTSCASPHLDAARENFYLGRLQQSEECLARLPSRHKDKVLFLMERAMIRQALHQFEPSAQDWVSAEALASELEYISVSREAAGFIINDRTTAFRGELYERVLLHSFAAKSYMALSLWDDAAVEARNIIDKLQYKDGYPDNCYAHYMAGLCMEMIFDYDAASRQYREAATLSRKCRIDEQGRILAPATDSLANETPATLNAELVCFISIGRSPTEYGNDRSMWNWGNTPYAEIYHKGKYLGRSFELSNTPDLLRATEKRHSVLRTARTAARIAMKEAAAIVVSEHDEFMGSLLRLLLFSMETPGPRRWETLPRWLHVARLPCPAQLSELEVRFRGRDGRTMEKKMIKSPLAYRNEVYVSFCRSTRR